MDARQMMVFGDNADDYRAFRPDYPDALFAWLAAVAKAESPGLGLRLGQRTGGRRPVAPFHTRARDGSGSRVSSRARRKPPISTVV